MCYTLTFLFYLKTSFSQQFNVVVFGSCCCFGFLIFLLWFIPSLVIVMCYFVLWFFMNVMLSRPSRKEYDFSVASDFVLLTTRTLWLCELHAFGFLLASSKTHIFMCLFYCSTLMHHVFSNLHEHFLLRSITLWFSEADAVLCAPSFQLDIFQVLWFWCVFQYFAFWWMWCAAPVRWNMIFLWCFWSLDLRTIPTFCILECSVFECLFALTKNYFGFFRNWCSTGSVCYTLAFLFYLITSFSEQFNVFVFGSWCCFGFSIFLLWFIPSLVILMCYFVLWFFMNVMLSRPSRKEYDFSVASDFVLLTTRTLWLCELHAFGFLLASSKTHIFMCLFYCSTLMHHVFSNLHEHFLLRSITLWFSEADAVLCAPSFQLDIFQVLWFWCVFQYFAFWWMWCAAPVRWNMIFLWCFWSLDLRTNPTFCIVEGSVFECLFAATKNYFGFFSKMMFYWFSVLHLDFPFLLDN